MGKRAKHLTDFGAGWSSGWREYRYGPTKPISLPRVFKGRVRERLVDSIMDGLRDWRSTPFEKEGGFRSGIRSAICLEGKSWPQADSEAADLLAKAFNRLGVERPSWAEGQLHHTDSLDRCSWCAGPIDEEDRTDRQRFCSVVCAKSALHHRVTVTGEEYDTVRRAARRLISRRNTPVKSCAMCGKRFQSERPEVLCCSTKCAAQHSKGDKLIPERPCSECGTIFQSSNRKARYCSLICRGAGERKKMLARLAEEVRSCVHCGQAFTPRTSFAKFCSTVCSQYVAKKAYAERQRQAKPRQDFYEITCQWCETPFKAKVSHAKYCCSEHSAAAQNRDRALRRQSSRSNVIYLTADVFDSWFKEAA